MDQIKALEDNYKAQMELLTNRITIKEQVEETNEKISSLTNHLQTATAEVNRLRGIESDLRQKVEELELENEQLQRQLIQGEVSRGMKEDVQPVHDLKEFGDISQIDQVDAEPIEGHPEPYSPQTLHPLGLSIPEDSMPTADLSQSIRPQRTGLFLIESYFVIGIGSHLRKTLPQNPPGVAIPYQTSGTFHHPGKRYLF